MNLKDQANGRWEGILLQLGVRKEFLKDKHGPCPACGGKDRFRFDNKNNNGDYYCGQCGAGDGFDLLMKINNWDFRTAAQEVEKIVGVVDFKPIQKKKDPLPRLKKIAGEAKSLNGSDPVTRYLNNRGLTKIPTELKQHPGLEYYEGKDRWGKYPAMLAVVQDQGGNNLTYHVTYIDGNEKANVPSPKKIMPPINPITGAAIRLFGTGEHICLSEGIETAIAAHEITGLPSWATISAGGLEGFQVPNGIKQVTIIADNDKKYAGQKAAYALANRLETRNKIKASVLHPIMAGKDLCDLFVTGEAEENLIYG